MGRGDRLEWDLQGLCPGVSQGRVIRQGIKRKPSPSFCLSLEIMLFLFRSFEFFMKYFLAVPAATIYSTTEQSNTEATQLVYVYARMSYQFSLMSGNEMFFFKNSRKCFYAIFMLFTKIMNHVSLEYLDYNDSNMNFKKKK